MSLLVPYKLYKSASLPYFVYPEDKRSSFLQKSGTYVVTTKHHIHKPVTLTLIDIKT